jgi:two-component system response regulator YesN
MLTVLIADDEPLTLQGIRNGIPWEELGIDTVLTAKNGINALEVLNGREPDILLTDVYMPRMDGIALARKVRAQFPQCTILFLTGYTRETYLRSAIEVKAEHYINKPVNTEELYEIFDDIIEKVQERQKAKYQLEQSYQIILAMMLSRNSVNPRELQETANAADFGILMKKPFCCVEFFMLNLDGHSVEEHDMDFEQMQMGIMHLFSSQGLIPLAYLDPENRIICFVFFRYAGQDRKLVKNLILKYRKKLPDECAIAISETAYSLEDSHQIFIEASERLQASFYLGTSSILEKSLMISHSDNMLSKLTGSIKEAIISGQYARVIDLFRELRDELVTVMPPLLYTKSLMQEILNLLNSQGEALSGITTDAYGRNDFFDNILTLDGCIGILLEKTNFLIHGHESGKYLAERAQTIIKHELSNTNLSITFLSDKMNITAPYLCYLFKQQYHETINHFINKTRTEKAKNLLSLSGLRIYEIAKQCGYSSTNYFTRTFKRFTGLLPTQYRRESKI